jgi:hypothetical protein
MDGKGHPLPASDEARHDEIPEHDARDKGLGDDVPDASRPDGEAVAPDGEAYPIDDEGPDPAKGAVEAEAERD